MKKGSPKCSLAKKYGNATAGRILKKQPTNSKGDLISDAHFQYKLRIDNPVTCARECNKDYFGIIIRLEFQRMKTIIIGRILGWSDTA